MNDAQKEVATLAADWQHWRRQLKPCCGIVSLKYEPGVTFAMCTGCNRKVAVPDWDPRGAVEGWNAKP